MNDEGMLTHSVYASPACPFWGKQSDVKLKPTAWALVLYLCTAAVVSQAAASAAKARPGVCDGHLDILSIAALEGVLKVGVPNITLHGVPVNGPAAIAILSQIQCSC